MTALATILGVLEAQLLMGENARRALAEGIVAALERDGLLADDWRTGPPRADVPAIGPTNGTPTSRAASYDNAPRSGTQRARVLFAIVARGDFGLTREELERYLSMEGNTI